MPFYCVRPYFDFIRSKVEVFSNKSPIFHRSFSDFAPKHYAQLIIAFRIVKIFL